MNTDDDRCLEGAADAGGQGIRLIRRLVIINLGLVVLQSLSAGFFVSGYERAVTVAHGRRGARTGAGVRLPEPGPVAVSPHGLAAGYLVAGA